MDLCGGKRLEKKNILVSFVLVYGPNDRLGINPVWRELIQLKQEVLDPMMVLGDFIEILKHEERKGNNIMLAGMRDFQNWRSEIELIELPLLSRKFTCIEKTREVALTGSSLIPSGRVSSRI